MVQFLHLRIDEVQKLHYYKLRGAIMMGELKKMRTEKKMTQQQVADLVGISLRSYKSYENDEKKQGSLKYKYILEKLSEINPIDEEHGIIDIEYITEKCGNVFQKYDVNFCYLFGSYAKSKAKPTSDVDLLISANVKGLKFYGLVEEIREALHKKVKNDRYYIQKIRNDLQFIVQHMKDVDIEELNANEILLDSMLFRMIQLSENAKKLSDEYKEKRGYIPWNAMYGLRNRIVHDYGNVDLNIVFETLKNDIPELLEMIKG